MTPVLAAPSPRLVRSRRLKGKLAVVLLTVIGALWVLPLVYMLDVSFRLPQDVFDPALFVPRFTFANYLTVINGNPLGRYFLNSAIVAVSSVTLVMALGAAFSFGVSVLRLPFAKTMYALILLTLMVPMAGLIVPLAILLNDFGWINTYMGLIFPHAALGIPFAVVILKAFMDTLSRELFEAAAIDGAKTWGLFIRVVLPMLRPSLIFVGIWQLITSWNEFFLALVVMTETSMKTLPLIPQQYAGVYLGNAGALFAILVLVAAPLIVLYVAVQRWFVAGMLEGALKA
jgi:raffinose/stachyose/melibiose transport system permease protein